MPWRVSTLIYIIIYYFMFLNFNPVKCKQCVSKKKLFLISIYLHKSLLISFKCLTLNVERLMFNMPRYTLHVILLSDLSDLSELFRLS